MHDDQERRLPGDVDEPMDPSTWRDLNRAWWDERVPLHVASAFYDDAGFRAGQDSLQPFEPPLLGDVTGLRLVHLQCHVGQDTLSWARRGASVVGLDFSPRAVEVANGAATDLELDGRFVCADVYDAADALDGERFDVVYTGFGAINWLPDIERWAAVVRSLLNPGGRLLLSEFHPISWAFGDDTLGVELDYFQPEPYGWEAAGSYADPDAVTTHNRTIERQHPLGAIFGALLGQGFEIRSFTEYDHTLFPRWEFLERHPDATYRFPPGRPRIPLMFTLLGQVPAGT